MPSSLVGSQIVVAIVVVGALLIGLAVNRFFRPRLTTDDDEVGDPVSKVLGPVGTLGTILLAFVFALSLSSFERARTAVATEARTVDYMFEAAAYAPEPQQEQFQAAALCYARAVSTEEWKSMEKGDPSPVPGNWTGAKGFRGVLAQLFESDDRVFSTLLAADKDRAAARGQRLTEASPAIPETVFWLMTLLVSAALIAAAIGVPRVKNRPQVIALVVVALAFASILALMRDIDRPFAGGTGVQPTLMIIAADDITEDFTEQYGVTRIPCDDRGRPKTA